MIQKALREAESDHDLRLKTNSFAAETIKRRK
jgi:hypothetical protein